MDYQEFKSFCATEFKKRGFKKRRNAYYKYGNEVLCVMDLQKSNYGACCYVNYSFFLGRFVDEAQYPGIYGSDVSGRITALSKTQTIKGEFFLTGMIEYEEYTESELRPFFDEAFERAILPPTTQGKKYILDNLNKIYSLALNREETMRKLQS